MSAVPAIAEPYQMTERADEEQILRLDKTVRDSLFYQVNGKLEMSLTCVNILASEMAKNGEPIQLDITNIKLEKFEEDDKTTWRWICDVKSVNGRTGETHFGSSTQAYLPTFRDGRTGTAMDEFGRTKAISKAERNALRKQLSKERIMLAYEQAKSTQIKQLDKTPKVQNARQMYDEQQAMKPQEPQEPGITREQIKEIASLDPDGKHQSPTTRREADDLIKKLKQAKPDKKTKDNDIDGPPTPAQLNLLKEMVYDGPPPGSFKEAEKLIVKRKKQITSTQKAMEAQK